MTESKVFVAVSLIAMVVIARHSLAGEFKEIEQQVVAKMERLDPVTSRERLLLIAADLQQNFESIQTLSATYRVKDSLWFDGDIGTRQTVEGEDLDLPALDHLVPSKSGTGYWQVSEQDVDIFLHRERDLHRVDHKPVKNIVYYDVKTGNTAIGPIGRTMVWSESPSGAYTFDVSGRKGQLQDFPPLNFLDETTKRVMYKKVPNSVRRNSQFVDIDRFEFSGSEPLYAYLNRIVEKSLDVEVYYLDENELTAVTREFTSGINYLMLFDGRHDSRLVRRCFSDENGIVNQDDRLTYDDSPARACIPTTVNMERYYSSSASNTLLTSYKAMELIDYSVNKKLPEGVFEPSNFGITYGERMIDEVAGELYVFDNENGFVLPEDFVFDRNKLPGQPRLSAFYIWLAVAFGVCVLAWKALKKRSM